MSEHLNTQLDALLPANQIERLQTIADSAVDAVNEEAGYPLMAEIDIERISGPLMVLIALSHCMDLAGYVLKGAKPRMIAAETQIAHLLSLLRDGGSFVESLVESMPGEDVPNELIKLMFPILVGDYSAVEDWGLQCSILDLFATSADVARDSALLDFALTIGQLAQIAEAGGAAAQRQLSDGLLETYQALANME